MYATKEKDGWCELWEFPPTYNASKDIWVGSGLIGAVSDDNIPKDLTFENSPMEVELKIKEEQ